MAGPDSPTCFAHRQTAAAKTEIFGPLAGTVPLSSEHTGACDPSGTGNSPGNNPDLAQWIVSKLGQVMVTYVNQQIIRLPIVDRLRKDNH